MLKENMTGMQISTQISWVEIYQYYQNNFFTHQFINRCRSSKCLAFYQKVSMWKGFFFSQGLNKFVSVHLLTSRKINDKVMIISETLK